MITTPRPTRQVVSDPTHEIVRRHQATDVAYIACIAHADGPNISA